MGGWEQNDVLGVEATTFWIAAELLKHTDDIEITAENTFPGSSEIHLRAPRAEATHPINNLSNFCSFISTTVRKEPNKSNTQSVPITEEWANQYEKRTNRQGT